MVIFFGWTGHQLCSARSSSHRPSGGWMQRLGGKNDHYDPLENPLMRPRPQKHSRWWQLIFFKFSSRKLGKMNPFWRAYFSNGLKPPTSVLLYFLSSGVMMKKFTKKCPPDSFWRGLRFCQDSRKFGGSKNQWCLVLRMLGRWCLYKFYFICKTSQNVETEILMRVLVAKMDLSGSLCLRR